jgi:hypothetical protein
MSTLHDIQSRCFLRYNKHIYKHSFHRKALNLKCYTEIKVSYNNEI